MDSRLACVTGLALLTVATCPVPSRAAAGSCAHFNRLVCTNGLETFSLTFDHCLGGQTRDNLGRYTLRLKGTSCNEELPEKQLAENLWCLSGQSDARVVQCYGEGIHVSNSISVVQESDGGVHDVYSFQLEAPAVVKQMQDDGGPLEYLGLYFGSDFVSMTARHGQAATTTSYCRLE